MNWLNIDTFFEHGELGIMTLVILIAAFLMFKAMKELGKREERAIEAIVNNTKAMQGVKDMAREIKKAVSYCPRRLRLELEQVESMSPIQSVDEENNDNLDLEDKG